MNLTPLELYKSHRQKFDKYSELLIKWNSKINLTAIEKPEEIEKLHFLDSLALAVELAPNVSRGTFSLLDIGAGAGLPGLAVKIVLPELELTLVDSVKKKCDFMKEVVRTLQLKKVTVLHQTMTPTLSVGSFDRVVSRAAFSIKDFIPLALPHLKPHGEILMMKGEETAEEIQEAAESMKLFQLEEKRYLLIDHQRKLLIFKRI
jgi:16S rRNA (guanine527-N7)-methyltransferase